MLADILPPGVAAREFFSDPPGLSAHPLEESMIARAVEKRRREFITARHCARLAMADLGVGPAAVLRGERNVPLWPRGIVGSLTHCEGYRAAALAHRLQYRSIGIDAEPNAPLPDGVLEHVSIPAERTWLASLTAGGPVHWDKLLFCAKESTYKAWFPLTGRWLGFEDAHITFAAGAEPAGAPENTAGETGTFTSRILVPGATNDGGPELTEFAGRWLVRDGLVVTAIVLA